MHPVLLVMVLATVSIDVHDNEDVLSNAHLCKACLTGVTSVATTLMERNSSY